MEMSRKGSVLAGCWAAVVVALGVGCSATDASQLGDEGAISAEGSGTDDIQDLRRRRRKDAGAPTVADSGTTPTTPADSGTTAPVDSGTSTPQQPAPGGIWKPTNGAPIHWHWQLSDDFVAPRDFRPGVTVYDIDGETSTAATVAALHALGPNVKVICYFDAGVYENYRSDKAKFPASVIGKADVGWPGAYWLDIRQLDIIMPIMKDRMVNWCKNKGFDAIEPDETEVWSNNSGFTITKAQNNAFNKAIADQAHALGLSVGLKGNNTEAADNEPYFDWALTEQCWEYDECDNFQKSFLAKGKAVFNIEYNVNPNCTQANAWHMNSARRDLNLVGPTNKNYSYKPCVPDSQNTW